MEQLLCVEHLQVHFDGMPPACFAVKDVSFSMEDGEILGLVGESGSGKSVTAMTICGLLDRKKAVVGGCVHLAGRQMLQLSGKELRQMQGTTVSVVFQEPMSSLNPLLRVGTQVEESLRVHTRLSAAQRRDRALAAMAQAELPEPERIYRKYPHELSGGMLQRVMIAAAIVSEPRLLIADEPTTALDVTVQAQILKLLKKLNRESGMAVLFISHNLQVVRKLCSRAAVMQNGQIVEQGDVEAIFRHPANEYTKRLIAAIPTRERN